MGRLGLPADPQAALPLLNRAATLATIDVPQPAYVYGLLLLNEFSHVSIPTHLFQPFLPPGVTPAEEARRHLERAAYLNFAPAQYKLGHAYEFATPPFPFDALLSVQYYSLASQQGEIEADMALSKWFLCGAEGAFDKDEGLAWTFAEKAARKGLASAEFALGYYSEVGVGGPRNIDAARKWYQRVRLVSFLCHRPCLGVFGCLICADYSCTGGTKWERGRGRAAASPLTAHTADVVAGTAREPDRLEARTQADTGEAALRGRRGCADRSSDAPSSAYPDRQQHSQELYERWRPPSVCRYRPERGLGKAGCRCSSDDELTARHGCTSSTRGRIPERSAAALWSARDSWSPRYAPGPSTARRREPKTSPGSAQCWSLPLRGRSSTFSTTVWCRSWSCVVAAACGYAADASPRRTWLATSPRREPCWAAAVSAAATATAATAAGATVEADDDRSEDICGDGYCDAEAGGRLELRDHVSSGDGEFRCSGRRTCFGLLGLVCGSSSCGTDGRSSDVDGFDHELEVNRMCICIALCSTRIYHSECLVLSALGTEMVHAQEMCSTCLDGFA